MANSNHSYSPTDAATGMFLAKDSQYYSYLRPAPPVVYGIDEPLERIIDVPQQCRYCGQPRREDERGGCAACGGPLK